MNVTVGKLRPLSRMVNPVWRAFMPISKWSQHDALAPELTTTGSQNLPECLLPCLIGSNNVPLPPPGKLSRTRVSEKPKPRSHLAGFLHNERQLLANPSYNESEWFRGDDEVHWRFGVRPKDNASFDWVQHFIHHLTPHGMAGFVLANSNKSFNQSGEDELRRSLIEADLMYCIVALPSQLICSWRIPVCLWIHARNKSVTGVLPASSKGAAQRGAPHSATAVGNSLLRSKQTRYPHPPHPDPENRARKNGTVV